MTGEIQMQVMILRRPPTSPTKERRFGPYTLTTDQTGNGVDDRTYSVGTTEETITFTDFTNSGLIGVANEDSTNYVDFGFSTGSYPLQLLKNEAYVFRLSPSTTTLYVRANTAACEVRVFGVEA